MRHGQPLPRISFSSSILRNIERRSAPKAWPRVSNQTVRNAIAQAWAQHMASTSVLVHQNLYDVIVLTSFTQMADNILVGPATTFTDVIQGVCMRVPVELGG